GAAATATTPVEASKAATPTAADTPYPSLSVSPVRTRRPAGGLAASQAPSSARASYRRRDQAPFSPPPRPSPRPTLLHRTSTKNKWIEEWNAGRENLEFNFCWTRHSLAVVGLFDLAVPILVYKGIVHEFVRWLT
ncbi:hypothetical protein BDA96_04G152300, partial [Sorghum bicolor]